MSTSPYYNKIQVDVKVDDLEQQIANVADGTAGKAYPDLLTAMSITPLPEDGIIFTIDEDNTEEAGIYAYDSGKVNGYRFVKGVGANGEIEEGNTQAVSGETINTYLQSIGVEDTLQVSDNNNNMQTGSYRANGIYDVSNNWVSIKWQDIKPNTTYTFWGHKGLSSSSTQVVIKNSSNVVIFTKNGNGTNPSGELPITFITPNDSYQIAINIASGTNEGSNLNEYKKKFILVEGDIAYPFQPYKKGIFEKNIIQYPLQIFISPDGVDTNPGTENNPVKTFNKACELVNKKGEIIFLSGDYWNFNINLTNAPYIVKAKTGDRVRIINGIKITEAELLDGYSNVYKINYNSSIHQLYNLWQHDIPDESTLISIDDRNPYNRGRQYRLPSTKIYKASSINEIEETSDKLMWFLDSSILYFSKITGSDLNINPIIIPNTSSIKSNISKEIKIIGIDFLYSPLTTTGLTGEIQHCSIGMVNGAGALVYDRTVGMKFYNLEVFGCNNDGCNGHTSGGVEYDFAKQTSVSFFDLYSHDNGDDGISCHAYCEESIFGGVIEYNGNGVTPAIGAHGTYYNIICKDNLQTGFSAQGASADVGIGTNAYFYNCISIRNEINFKGVDNSTKFFNCSSINPTTTHFGNGQKINCFENGILIN